MPDRIGNLWSLFPDPRLSIVDELVDLVLVENRLLVARKQKTERESYRYGRDDDRYIYAILRDTWAGVVGVAWAGAGDYPWAALASVRMVGLREIHLR